MSGIELFAGVTLGDALFAASTLVGTVGQIQQGQAAKAAGQAQAQSAQYQAALQEKSAKSIEQQASEERASAQRASIEQRRQGKLASSRAQTVAAASGAGALDPTIVNIMGDLDTETEYRALTAMYEGEERARGLETEAGLRRAGAAGTRYGGEVARVSGNAAARRSYYGAAGTLLEGGGRLYDRYSSRKPQTLKSKYGYMGPEQMDWYG